MLLACIAGWRRLVALLVTPASVTPAALLLVAAASATSSAGTQTSQQQARGLTARNSLGSTTVSGPGQHAS